ncbi:MAG: MBL fold metallo-hydrolase [Kiritimatiellae bacterium]|nr:MBL fold metallo-hydrolase [Kiritimatiellia bacterium]
MQRKTMAVGSFEANCSIFDGWIVDPGAEASRIAAALQGVAPKGVLLTHAHFDHLGAIGDLQRMFPGLKVFVHPEDAKIITHPLNNFPPDYPPVAMPDNVVWDIAEIKGCEAIETPGHTPGGVCYYFPEEKIVFTGDTLFNYSVGRTDLPGGDMAALMASLKKLVVLPEETEVVPGHGAFTTIGAEKRGNPFLLG